MTALEESTVARVGVPLTLEFPCAGLAPGSKFPVKVFEPSAMGADPLETFDATVGEDGSSAVARWTYDHAKHGENVSAAVFVFLAEAAGRTTISRPVRFLDTFEATIKDQQGHPAAYRQVTLHAARGEDIATQTDENGKITALVPPGDYQVELLGPIPGAPPPRATPVEDTTAPPPPATTAAADGAVEPFAVPGVVAAPEPVAEEKPGGPPPSTEEPPAPGEGWAVLFDWHDPDSAFAKFALVPADGGTRREIARDAATKEGDLLRVEFPAGAPGIYDVLVHLESGEELAWARLDLPGGKPAGEKDALVGGGAPAGDGGAPAPASAKKAVELPDAPCNGGGGKPSGFKTRLELPGGHFDFDSSFVRKDGLADLAKVHDRLVEDSTRVALIYGHTDTVGADDYNKRLSERRARSALAILMQDAKTLEDLYQGESWGLKSVQRMLNAVAAAGLDEDGKDGPNTQDAVRAFQASHGLDVDGKAGPNTRAVLFVEYAKLAGSAPLAANRFFEFGGGRFMGCGEFNPLSESGPDEASRRVEIFIFDPDSAPKAVPCRLGDLAPCRKRLFDPGEGSCSGSSKFRCSFYRQLTAVASQKPISSTTTSVLAAQEKLATDDDGKSLAFASTKKGAVKDQEFLDATTHIQIADLDELFMKETIQHLYFLWRTPTGKKLIKVLNDRLGSEGQTVEITTQDEVGNDKCDAKFLTDVDGAKGGSIVYYDPFHTEFYKGDEGWQQCPAAIVLAHELIHALHNILGSYKAETDRAPNGTKAPKTHRREEIWTSGIPLASYPGDATENQIRKEYFAANPKDTRYFRRDFGFADGLIGKECADVGGEVPQRPYY